MAGATGLGWFRIAFTLSLIAAVGSGAARSGLLFRRFGWCRIHQRHVGSHFREGEQAHVGARAHGFRVERSAGHLGRCGASTGTKPVVRGWRRPDPSRQGR
jgi:hypothetical protein